VIKTNTKHWTRYVCLWK